MSQHYVTVQDDNFYINGKITLEGKKFRGMDLAGLLPNSRMVQGIFDDENPATRSRWNYPDGPWDPERNTREFVDAMASWKDCGLLSFTLGLQGGSPEGYSNIQPWVNSAFSGDGSLKPEYCARLEQILDRADSLGMIPILNLFYFGQDERLENEEAVFRAADNIVDWLVGRQDIEVVNETDSPSYEHSILRTERISELIKHIQNRSAGKLDTPAGRFLVGTSFGGGVLPTAKVMEVSDVLIVHGNDEKNGPARIREMVRQIRADAAYRGQPIVFNEDDHFDFDKPDNNFLAATESHASWGYFDYRFAGEGFVDGYQSMACSWGIDSERKKAFFGLLREMTQGQK